MAHSTVSYLWRDKDAAKGFRAGVSLHSHTNQSKETLDFLANLGNQYPAIRPLLTRLERRSEETAGPRVNYAASYWTPPMTPQLAFDLESRQIETLVWPLWFQSPITTTSTHQCCCGRFQAREEFPFRSSGAFPTEECRPFTSAFTICRARARRSGCGRSTISQRARAKAG